MKLLKDKILGQVIIVTEGEKDEIELFEKIFEDIFNCEVVELTHRDGQESNFVCKICKIKNENSKILLLNARHSNIKYADDIDFLNRAYSELIENYSYDIDIENSKIFFVFDRDCKSNNNSIIICNLIEKFKDPYDINDTPGLLILNYPSIESYILSTKIDKTFALKFELGKDIKKYNKYHSRVKICDIDDNCLLHAYEEFCDYILNIGAISEWNKITQNIAYTYQNINKMIYNKQEDFFKIEKKYQAFSSVSMIFYSLGIITEDGK